MVAPSRFRYNRGVTSTPGALQTAAGPGFRDRMTAMAGNPGLRALGITLAGLPIAFGAVDQLGREADNGAGNLAGGVGSVVGGIGGGLGGALIGGKLGGPIGALAGGALGSWAGGELLGGAARGVTNAVTGIMDDPLAKEIKAAERMARSQIAMQNEAVLSGLPAMRALAAQRAAAETERAQLASRMYGQQLYQEAMLGPSRVPAGAYFDPSQGNALAAIASGAFV